MFCIRILSLPRCGFHTDFTPASTRCPKAALSAKGRLSPSRQWGFRGPYGKEAGATQQWLNPKSINHSHRMRLPCPLHPFLWLHFQPCSALHLQHPQNSLQSLHLLTFMAVKSMGSEDRRAPNEERERERLVAWLAQFMLCLCVEVLHCTPQECTNESRHLAQQLRRWMGHPHPRLKLLDSSLGSGP